MASRTLPGLGLNGFWALGEDGWKTGMDSNLLVLSALVQPRVLDIVNADPGSPADGDIYYFGDTHPTHADSVAVRDNGAWVYIAAFEGMELYNVSDNKKYRYNGTTMIPLTDVNLIRPVAAFFTVAPTASEVLALYVAVDAFTLAANLVGSKVIVGTNPTATFAIDVQRNGVTIATISISVGGVVTLTTVGGTSKAIAVNDVIKLVAPAVIDATIANVAYTLLGIAD